MTTEDTWDIRPLRSDEADYLRHVRKLADKHRRTLGFLPAGAFPEFVARCNVIVALRNGMVGGYAIIDLPGQKVKLVQLCVAPPFRKNGLAKAIIDHISQTYANRTGISLKCRREFPASTFWPSLGFQPLRDVPGRSKAGHLLTIWWKDHGSPDLFSVLSGDEKLRGAYDANVFRDIYGTARPSGEESIKLAKSPKADRIEFIVTGQLRIELNRHTEDVERKRLLDSATAFRAVHVDHHQMQELSERLRVKCAEHGVKDDGSLVADLELISAASLAGADLFITRDQNLLDQVSGAIESEVNIRLIRPSELLIFLDQEIRAAAYRPVDFQGTSHSIARLGSADSQDFLRNFLRSNAGERITDLRRRWIDATLGIDDSNSGRFGWVGPDGDLIAIYVLHVLDGRLQIPVLRTVDGPLGSTVLLQLLFSLRREAAALHRREVRITDQSMSDEARTLLAADGFNRDDNGWSCAVLNQQSPAQDLGRDPIVRCIVGRSEPEFLESSLTPHEASTIEHNLWPLKVSDAPLYNYLVPIQPSFADDLIGTGRTLFGRSETLALSRENVYYKSGYGTRPKAPSRILWYVSGKGKTRVSAVVAASRLTEVAVGSPSTLHRRFGRLGVWTIDQIQKAATPTGSAIAFLFEDTEIFPRGVLFERLTALAGDCRIGTIRSATSVPNHLYLAIYREGRMQC